MYTGLTRPVELVLAVVPVLDLTAAALAARPLGGVRSVGCRHRTLPSHLNPAAMRVEFLRIAAAQDLERSATVLCEVQGAVRVLKPVPGRRHEISHQDALDLVAVLVALDRVADLAGPEHPVSVLVGAVDPRIYGHLADLMRRPDANAGVVREQHLDKHFRQRQPLVRQVVIGESAGLVAVVEKYDPPRTSRRRLILR